jgi:hypothetical protein
LLELGGKTDSKLLANAGYMYDLLMLHWQLPCSRHDMLYCTNILKFKLILFLHDLFKYINLEVEQLSHCSDYATGWTI